MSGVFEVMGRTQDAVLVVLLVAREVQHPWVAPGDAARGRPVRTTRIAVPEVDHGARCCVLGGVLQSETKDLVSTETYFGEGEEQDR